jgi:hypothetical protein
MKCKNVYFNTGEFIISRLNIPPKKIGAGVLGGLLKKEKRKMVIHRNVQSDSIPIFVVETARITLSRERFDMPEVLLFFFS